MRQTHLESRQDRRANTCSTVTLQAEEDVASQAIAKGIRGVVDEPAVLCSFNEKGSPLIAPLFECAQDIGTPPLIDRRFRLEAVVRCLAVLSDLYTVNIATLGAKSGYAHRRDAARRRSSAARQEAVRRAPDLI